MRTAPESYLIKVKRNFANSPPEERALGLVNEASEVAQIIRKSVFQRRILDIEHLKLELGDDLNYLVAVMDYYKIDINEIFKIAEKTLDEKYKMKKYNKAKG